MPVVAARVKLVRLREHSPRSSTDNSPDYSTDNSPFSPEKSSKEPGDDIEQLPVDKIALILPGFVILAGKILPLF